MPFDSAHDDELFVVLPSDSPATINLINGYHKIKAGWTQSRYYNRMTNEVCALGALGIHHGAKQMQYISELTYLSRALGYPFSRSDEITRFNDSSKTYQNDVLNLYANAIRISRKDSA